ncbi:hypothetical protein K474DRAFT_1669752 [Panus rudis PR-1116 ss-1]|nr:hypothetical protein K474DRAFT_1669752 [Panus rudis PR-1116 ss-1]
MYDDNDIVYTSDPEEVELVDLSDTSHGTKLVGTPLRFKLKSHATSRRWVKEEQVAPTLNISEGQAYRLATPPSTSIEERGAAQAVHPQCEPQPQWVPIPASGASYHICSEEWNCELHPPHSIPPDSIHSPERPPSHSPISACVETSSPTGQVNREVLPSRPLRRRDPNRWIRIFVDPFDPQPDNASNSLWLPSLRDPSIPPGVRVAWRASIHSADTETNADNEEYEVSQAGSVSSNPPPTPNAELEARRPRRPGRRPHSIPFASRAKQVCRRRTLRIHAPAVSVTSQETLEWQNRVSTLEGEIRELREQVRQLSRIVSSGLP